MGNARPKATHAVSTTDASDGAALPAWVNPRTSEPEQKIGTNFYLSKNGKGYRVRFRGPDPLSGERVQRSRQFPLATPREELERLVSLCERRQRYDKLLRNLLGRQERSELEVLEAEISREYRRLTGRHDGQPIASRPLRPLMAAKWVTVPKGSGIHKSKYGWRVQWCETDALTGERVQRVKTFPTTVPPGDAEPPPAYVARYREERKREGLKGKRRRRDIPKKNVRAIQLRLVPASDDATKLAQRVRAGARHGAEVKRRRSRAKEELIAQAAKGVAAKHPDWSDRAIAKQLKKDLAKRLDLSISEPTIRRTLRTLRQLGSY